MGVIQAQSAQIQAQSTQISELMQIVKGLGRLQEQTLAASTKTTPATGAEEKTGDDATPMEVDKDTGGVMHSKAEQYLPKIPMLNYEKMVSRSSEINYWTEFVEAISSWLALLDDFYPVELYRASITDAVVRQDALEKGPAARSSRFHNLLKQSLVRSREPLMLFVKQSNSRWVQRVGMKPSEGSTKNSGYSPGWKQVQSESLC